MAEKVDLSLDDIIKMNKNKNQKRGNPKPQQKNRLQSLGARSKLVSKKQGGPRNNNSNNSNNHSSPIKRESAMLHVSNLHFNVSNEDIRELFSEVGPLRKAAVHYDRSGRSLGTAEVIYSTRDAAVRAIKKYHNLPLDGRPMNITLVPSRTNVSQANTKVGVRRQQKPGVFKKPQQNIKRGGGGGPPTRGGRQSNTRGKPQGRGQPKKPVTAEQLDADLEAYTTHTMDVA